MAKKTNTFDYKALVRYMLPKGMLDQFEVTRVEEKHTGEKDETGTEICILHVYLDELDRRDNEWHDLQPNGFTEYREFNDFPLREYKVALHVRRRRWLTGDGKSRILETKDLTAEGTCYSVEFAAFLKEVVGYLPGDGPMRGAILPDGRQIPVPGLQGAPERL